MLVSPASVETFDVFHTEIAVNEAMRGLGGFAGAVELVAETLDVVEAVQDEDFVFAQPLNHLGL
jgi:hypothetical protein